MDFVTIGEAADMLGVSVPTIYNMLKDGRLKPAFKGIKTGVSIDSIQKHVRSQGIKRDTDNRTSGLEEL